VPSGEAMSRKRGWGFAMLGLSTLLIAASLFVAPGEGSSQAWLGYRVLLVDAAIPETELLGRLAAGGVRDLVSESTEPVLLSDWKGLEVLSLAEARARLLPEDPRNDGYISRLGLWFEGRLGQAPSRVFFLRVGPFPGGEARLARTVAEALRPLEGRYALPESHPASSSSPSWLAFALAFVSLAFGAAIGPFLESRAPCSRGRIIRERLALRFCLVAPWVALARGGMGGAAVGALCGIALAELADALELPLGELRRGRGLRSALGAALRGRRPALAVSAMALVALAANPGELPAALFALAAGIGAVAGLSLVSEASGGRRGFAPLPIAYTGKGRRRGSGTIGATRAGLALGAAAVLVLSGPAWRSAPSRGEGDWSYPEPIEASGSLQPGPAEARAKAAAGGDRLPGLAEYLEHRAAQEALPFARVGEARADPFGALALPSRGARVAAPVFDEAWARSAYGAIPPMSIEGMILAQGRPVDARAATRVDASVVSALGADLAPSSASGKGPLAPIRTLLYILLLVPPIGRTLAGLANGRLRYPSTGELRQEA
jgi:hypothetical protein